MKSDEEEEEEEAEEEEEEEAEPREQEFSKNAPTEKYMIFHSQKGIVGGSKPSYLAFIPDPEFLEKTFGDGLFTICEQSYNSDKKKIVWTKIKSISVNADPETDKGVVKKKQNPIFSGGASSGVDLLHKTGEEIREMAISKLIMAFANTMEKGDYEGAKTIGNMLTGSPEQKEDSRYQKLIDKLIDTTLTQKIDPVGSLQDQIKTLKSLKGLMESPAEQKDTWSVLMDMADKHLPSIMATAKENTKLQKEMIDLRKKEAEAHAATTTPAPVNAAEVQPQINPVAPKPPILDRFLIQILRDADATQLQGLVSLNLDKKGLEPMVKNAFNIELMPDAEYNELCGLFEQKQISVSIALNRLTELSVQNPNLKNLTLILRTPSGQELLKKILEIVEGHLFSVGVPQTSETPPELTPNAPFLGGNLEGKKEKKGVRKNASTNTKTIKNQQG